MYIVEINIRLPNQADTIDIDGYMQSRVIECDTWSEYINHYIKYNGETAGDYIPVIGSYIGFTLPKMCKISDLSINGHTLTCKIHTWNNSVTTRFACVVE